MTSRAIGAWLLGTLLVLAPGPARAAPGGAELLAGASRRSITPSHPVWLAGHGIGPVRRSQGEAADGLHVRALALSQGDQALVLVSADLAGLFRQDVEAIRARVAAGWREEEGRHPAVIVACTHTHSGPDMLGFWGGVSRGYREYMREETARAVLEALEAREPARLAIATVPAPGRIRNRRDLAGPTAEVITALRLYGAEGTSLATVVGFNAHPVLLGPGNRLLSADFPGYLAARLEERTGGVVLYFTGAAGDQSPVAPGGSGPEVARAYGEALADLVEAAFRLHPGSDPAAAFEFAGAKVAVPVSNWRLAIAGQLGPAARPVRKGMVETEAWFIRLGQARLATLPGEVLAAGGERLQALAGEGPLLLIGLANDALGYLVPAVDWRPGGYEESLAASPVAADLLLDEVLRLAAAMAGDGAPAQFTDPVLLAAAQAAARRLGNGLRAGAIAVLLALLAFFAALPSPVRVGGRGIPGAPRAGGHR